MAEGKGSSVINNKLGNRQRNVSNSICASWTLCSRASHFILQEYKALVSRQTRPLYELVTSRDFTQASTLKRNLKRALSHYLAEASSCRCAPCLNNGVAVLRGIDGIFYGSTAVADIIALFKTFF